MTKNQIDYGNYREAIRSNLARELENYRHNTAVEAETHRSNVFYEGETRRHNVVTENETHRHNVVSEQNEIQRAWIAYRATVDSANISAKARMYDTDQYWLNMPAENAANRSNSYDIANMNSGRSTTSSIFGSIVSGVVGVAGSAIAARTATKNIINSSFETWYKGKSKRFHNNLNMDDYLDYMESYDHQWRDN